jgi:hypothetical protein
MDKKPSLFEANKMNVLQIYLFFIPTTHQLMLVVGEKEGKS